MGHDGPPPNDMFISVNDEIINPLTNEWQVTADWGEIKLHIFKRQVLIVIHNNLSYTVSTATGSHQENTEEFF